MYMKKTAVGWPWHIALLVSHRHAPAKASTSSEVVLAYRSRSPSLSPFSSIPLSVYCHFDLSDRPRWIPSTLCYYISWQRLSLKVISKCVLSLVAGVTFRCPRLRGAAAHVVDYNKPSWFMDTPGSLCSGMWHRNCLRYAFPPFSFLPLACFLAYLFICLKILFLSS